jgi:hypothetical protein
MIATKLDRSSCALRSPRVLRINISSSALSSGAGSSRALADLSLRSSRTTAPSGRRSEQRQHAAAAHILPGFVRLSDLSGILSDVTLSFQVLLPKPTSKRASSGAA